MCQNAFNQSQPDFVHVDTTSQKCKIKIECLVGMTKNACGQSGRRTLKLAVCQE